MFVPTVTTPPPPPSPQAQELGQRIALLVREFRVEQPQTGPVDVARAFQVARTLLSSELGDSSAPARAVALALFAAILGIAAFGLAVAIWGRGAFPGGISLMTAAVGLLILVALLVAVLKR